MEIEGRITLLVDRESATLKLYDQDAGITFVDLQLPPEEFTAALGRQAMVPCKIQVQGADRIGKKEEISTMNFELDRDSYDRETLKQKARTKAKELCEGTEWEPDLHFSSQGSFWFDGEKRHAKTTIRRWVDKEE